MSDIGAARLRRSVGTLELVALAFGLTACGSTGPPAIPFTDTNGRSCNYASIAPYITCDVDPATLVVCTSGAPDYILDGPVHVGEPEHLCAGCRVDTSFTIDYATCASIECSQDSDCPLSNYRCGAGLCVLR